MLNDPPLIRSGNPFFSFSILPTPSRSRDIPELKCDVSQRIMKLKIVSAKQVVRVAADGRKFLRGDQMRELNVLEMKDQEGFSIVVNE